MSQFPLHALSQHTPSLQKPDRHCVAAVHATPCSFLAEQYVPLQYVLLGQPLVQVMGQSASEPLHTTPMPQAGEPALPDAAGEQVPGAPGSLHTSQLPLHALSQHTPSAQKPVEHCTLAVHASPEPLKGMQAPLPQKCPGAHCCAVVHVVGHAPLTPSHAYAPQAVTCVDSGTGLQTPAVPTLSQRSHAPAHARSQHTPCAQEPDTQSLPLVHAPPCP